MSSVHTPSRWQWGYALALAATVVWASSFGQVELPDCADFVNFDKLAHASVFGLMATLVLRPFRMRPIVWSIVIVSLFGAADELHQNFTPGRSMDILDWVADTTGAVVAVSAYTFWGGYRRVLEFKLLKRKPLVPVSVADSAPGAPSPATPTVPASATVAAPVVTPIPPAS
jgi:VanZ family protein